MKNLFNAVRNLYMRNRNGPLRFRPRDPVIGRLFQETKRYVSPKSLFYAYVIKLVKHNYRSSVNFKRNDNFFSVLYREAQKLLRPKPTPQVSSSKPPSSSKPTSSSSKKAALLIGINYKGTDAELRGCENDIRNTKNVLIQKYGFKESDIVVLTESLGSHRSPTRNNILRYIKWLVDKSNAGYGSIWFQYSGHGTYITDTNGDEKDGRDECIYTCDEQLIVDDEFRNLLVSRVNKNSKLFCFMDCCHSGTIMDLKYKYKSGSNSPTIENSKKPAPANVIALSGCRDTQTSADAWLSGSWCGALTKTFLDVLRQSNYNVRLFDMVNKIRSQLQRDRFTQVPQLTSSRQLSTSSKFVL